MDTHQGTPDLSRKYPKWGLHCTVLDFDFAILEDSKGEAAAIVAYNRERAAPEYASIPSYQVLIDIGARAGVPVLACQYTQDFSTFAAVPLNSQTEKYLTGRTQMTEPEWVMFLYTLRGMDCPQSVIERIGTDI